LKKKDPSTVDKLLVKIIDNLQISIKNVYFRYEDEYSAPKQGSGKFAMGILLKELSAFTTNEEWKEKEMVTGSDITFKLGLVKGLTVFLDYDNKNFKGPSLVENSGINYEALTADTKN
jgi:vacuolar protein sorting-associated protein 13A/C